MADANSSALLHARTNQAFSEISSAALRDAATAPTVYDALDITGEALLRVVEFVSAESSTRDGLPFVYPDVLHQREQASVELHKAYILVSHLGGMDAAGLDLAIGNFLAAGAAEHVDGLLEHLDCAAGAWRELAEHADLAIDRVAASLTRTVLERAATVEAGNA